MSNKNIGEHIVSRRQALASLCAVGAAGLGIPTAAAAPNRVQVRLGTYESPVPEQEKIDARRRAFEAFRSAGGHFDSPMCSAEREGDGDEELAGYLATVTDAGQFREFVAYASDAAEAERARERVQDVAANLRGDHGSTTATSDSTSTQSRSWKWFYSHTSWTSSDPHGEMENRVELFHLEDDGRENYEAFITKHEIEATPGKQKYDSDWGLSNIKSEQDWENASELYRTVDFQPAQSYDETGTINASVSPEPTYDYSWYFDGWRFDRTSDQNDHSNGIGRWKGIYSSRGSTDTSRIIPSSSAWIYQHNSGTYDLATMTAAVRFYYSDGYDMDNKTLSETKTMQVEFTSDGPYGDTKD